jgi:MFS family permease
MPLPQSGETRSIDGASPVLPTAFPWVSMLLLVLIYTLNFFDRQVMTILVEPIKADLGLSDKEIGALSGFSFALLYTVAGLPLARIADRGNRVKMITVALTVWSGFTMACGLSRNFWQMALMRVGVGVGEAGCTPAAHSLITDSVPRERRAFALALYQMGVPLGSLAGLAVGGVLVSTLGWRSAFFFAGGPGLLLALILPFILKEPRRGLGGVVAAPAADHPTLKATLAILWQKKSFRCLCLASAFSAFCFYGQTAFIGSLYLRTHTAALDALAAQAGMAPIALLGIILGLLVGVCGGIGTAIGGLLSDKMARNSVAGYFRFTTIVLLMSVPAFAGLALSNDIILSFLLFGVALFFQTMSYGPVFAAIQTLAEPRMRGMAVAIQLLMVNIIALAFGPFLVGMVSDALHDSMGPTMSLRLGMAACAGVMLASVLLFGLGARWADTDEAR